MNRIIKILIAEHNPNDLELIQYELQKGGINHLSETVSDETGFANALKNFTPDLILSDYTFPNFNGLSAFKIKEALAPNTPFIFVSGTIGEENSLELLKNGVTDYVLKDKLHTLCIKVKRALNESLEKRKKIKAELELKQSERRLAKAQQIAHVGSWELDLQTNVAIWSAEACKIYGLDPNEYPHSFETFLKFIHPEDLDYVLKKVNASKDSFCNNSFYYRIIRPDGAILHIHTESIYEFDSNNVPVCLHVITIDATERVKVEEEIKQSHLELRQLSAHLQTAREEERTGIARVIHDELGQQLTVFKMDVLWLVKKIAASEKAIHEKLAGMTTLINDTINSIRKISSDLRPGILDDLGLIATLDWQRGEFEKHSGVRCSFKTKLNEIHLDRNLATGVFRIYQEALTNVMRYAKATLVETEMEQNENGIKMTIRDNGQGFDLSLVKSKKTLGIIGMRERALMFGATLSIKSQKGQGTEVVLEIPAASTAITDET